MGSAVSYAQEGKKNQILLITGDIYHSPRSWWNRDGVVTIVTFAHGRWRCGRGVYDKLQVASLRK